MVLIEISSFFFSLKSNLHVAGEVKSTRKYKNLEINVRICLVLTRDNHPEGCSGWKWKRVMLCFCFMFEDTRSEWRWNACWCPQVSIASKSLKAYFTVLPSVQQIRVVGSERILTCRQENCNRQFIYSSQWILAWRLCVDFQMEIVSFFHILFFLNIMCCC